MEDQKIIKEVYEAVYSTLEKVIDSAVESKTSELKLKVSDLERNCRAFEVAFAILRAKHVYSKDEVLVALEGMPDV